MHHHQKRVNRNCKIDVDQVSNLFAAKHPRKMILVDLLDRDEFIYSSLTWIFECFGIPTIFCSYSVECDLFETIFENPIKGDGDAR